MKKPTFDIDNTLTSDQCWHGFDHTQNEIILWLLRSTPEAQEQFAKAVREAVDEKARIEHSL